MQPDGALADAVHAHGAVLMSAACALTGATYDKVLSAVGIGVRERAAAEVVREPTRSATPVGELTVGTAATTTSVRRSAALEGVKSRSPRASLWCGQ